MNDHAPHGERLMATGDRTTAMLQALASLFEETLDLLEADEAGTRGNADKDGNHGQLAKYTSGPLGQWRLPPGLGNIVVDHFDVLKTIRFPMMPNLDALCYWYDMSTRGAEGPFHPVLSRTRSCWGDSLWSLGTRDSIVFLGVAIFSMYKLAVMNNIAIPMACVKAEQRASAMVRSKIQRNDLNAITIVNISGLSFFASLTGRSEECAMHHDAFRQLAQIAPTVRPSKHEWLYSWCGDIRLASMSTRPPALPFFVPEEWLADCPVTPAQHALAMRSALLNLRSLGGIASAHHQVVLQLLTAAHKLNLVEPVHYTAPHPHTSEPQALEQHAGLPLAIAYDATYNAGVFHGAVAQQPKQPNRAHARDLVELTAIALKSLAWMQATHLIVQTGESQTFLTARALQFLPDPETVVERWRALASVPSLLWILYILAAECCIQRPADLHHWTTLMRKPMAVLHISSQAAFLKTMAPFPVAQWWNKKVLPFIWEDIKPTRNSNARWQLVQEKAEHPGVNGSYRKQFLCVFPFESFYD